MRQGLWNRWSRGGRMCEVLRYGETNVGDLFDWDTLPGLSEVSDFDWNVDASLVKTPFPEISWYVIFRTPSPEVRALH